MKNKKLKLVLLAYLILFWNLGPSLHHADLLGLHLHHAHGHFGTDSNCCHQHSQNGHRDTHSHQLDCKHAHSFPCNHDHDSSGTKERETVSSFHACSICQFFEQFNGVVNAKQPEIDSSPVAHSASTEPVLWDGDFLFPTARGPPLA